MWHLVYFQSCTTDDIVKQHTHIDMCIRTPASKVERRVAQLDVMLDTGVFEATSQCISAPQKLQRMRVVAILKRTRYKAAFAEIMLRCRIVTPALVW